MGQLATRVSNPALALLVVSGVYLVTDGDWGFGTAWVATSLALSIMAAALAWRRGTAAVTGALTVAVTFLMVTKPG